MKGYLYDEVQAFYVSLQVLLPIVHFLVLNPDGVVMDASITDLNLRFR
jgi:hypothetical protein